MGDAVVADERPDGVVREELHRLCRVSDRETVLADEHRQQHIGMLCDPRCQHGQVVSLLGVLGEQLHDAGIADQHRVRVVAVDVDRSGERAVADCHHDRCAHRGGDVDDLGHQCESLRRRRRHRPGARESGADRRAHRRMLGLDVHDLCVRPAIGDELRERLDDRCLRRDRIDRHDVGIDLTHRVGDCLAAGQELARHGVVPPRPSRSHR